MQEKINIFLSYAHEDDSLRNELMKHLKVLEREGLVNTWCDRNISAGTEWQKMIDTRLENADMILLLISPDFMHSDYCYSTEMKKALERHDTNKARVIPVLLRPVDWEIAPFSTLQILPTNAKAVTAWPNLDSAFEDVTREIRKIVEAKGTSSNGVSRNDECLLQYLRFIIETNQGLNPRGFSQQSQPLISVNVPLDDIFIHLRALSDRPIYDMPHTQKELIETIYQRIDLSAEEKEDLVQKIRISWVSEQGQQWYIPLSKIHQKQHVDLEDILLPLRPENPGAIILGAPGSGKSTALRWLTLQLARNILSLDADLPEGWSFVPIPILLRISDFAKYLESGSSSFKKFFAEQFSEIQADLPSRLLDELAKGHCLLLFDGLDEVASDSLRRRIADAIFTFLTHFSTNRSSKEQAFNRIIITSRIVGYEPGTFAKYAHYTLLDLEDWQIEAFLTAWCPAVERYQAMFAQAMKPLTPQQETEIKKRGEIQRDRLLNAFENSAGLKHLAVNPLMLTILALIQRSGNALPHRRIDLYKIVTRTMLDNWNQGSGRIVIEAELAEAVLSELGYRLQCGDPVLTEQQVSELVQAKTTEFYGHTITENDSKQFIKMLRHSSGLFVESGQGLFCFIHRTFQEYFAALHLFHQPSDYVKQFVVQHYRTAIWREPLLLLIAYKSGQSGRSEKRLASELVLSILDTGRDYDAILHRNVFFAAACMVDCGVWSINPALQHRIIIHLIDLYGDSYGAGRFTQIQQNIEMVALHWLRGQPQGRSEQRFWPPMLEAWRTALCDDKNVIRQEGAVHLLAAIAPDLTDCPSSVLLALIPPLLHLTNMLDFPCPQEIDVQLQGLTAHPASSKVEDYACLTLRLLDTVGPAGWLHSAWLKWHEEQPELLKRLTQHAFELNYLLTPAALPVKRSNPKWDTLHRISEAWTLCREGFEPQVDPHSLEETKIKLEEMHTRMVEARETGEYLKAFLDWKTLRKQQELQIDPPSLEGLQTRLLEASDTVGYPHAFILWQLLKKEEVEASKDLSWRFVWDTFLQEEMARGRSATYQTCLGLRLLLCREDVEHQQKIANELTEALLSNDPQHTQALIALISIFLLFMQDLIDLPTVRGGSPFEDENALRNIQGEIYVQGSSYHYENLDDLRLTREQLHLGGMRRILGARIEDELLRSEEHTHIRRLRYMLDTLDLLDFGQLYSSLHIVDNLGNIRYDLADLGKLVGREHVTLILCKLLEQRTDSNSLLLFSIFSIFAAFFIADNAPPAQLEKHVQDALQAFIQQGLQLTIENRQLISALLKLANSSRRSSERLSSSEAVDRWASRLHTLRQHHLLTKSQVEDILKACGYTDKPLLSQSIQKEVGTYYVHLVAWRLLITQPFALNEEALHTIIQDLDSESDLVCGAAAFLLMKQRSHTLPQSARQEAVQKIMRILTDYKLSYRPLHPQEFHCWRLDEVLFDTLEALVEPEMARRSTLTQLDRNALLASSMLLPLSPPIQY